jgi:hypothetical protein
LVDHILPSPTPTRPSVPQPTPSEVPAESAEERAPVPTHLPDVPGGEPETEEEPGGPPSDTTPEAEATEVPPQEEEPPINLNPDTLRIEEVEREFISQLAELIPTPRAAKRFINIYRLIRATVSPEDLPGFVGEPGQPGEHRAVMVLLAVLTGFPRQAPYVFRKILTLAQDTNWESAIGALRPQQTLNAQRAQYHNSVIPAMKGAEAAQWKRLCVALSAFQPATPATLAPYIKWAPHVARFSFRVGKVAGGYSLAADIQITHVEYNPPGDGVAGEYVRIENLGDTAQPMTDWTLSDEAHNTFTFPAFTLPEGGMVNVWVGEGTDTPTDLHWGRASVWNNEGDTAELRDASGILIATYTIQPKE